MAKCGVWVPILGSDRVLGSLQLENHDREFAFGESEVRLLQTVAASMGVALENARLFDETQRLLKETEQRNAELAIINSVQAGDWPPTLDFQGIVRPRRRQVARDFPHRGHRHPHRYDPSTGSIHHPMPTSTGQRLSIPRDSPLNAWVT